MLEKHEVDEKCPRYPDIRVELTGQDGNAFAILQMKRSPTLYLGERLTDSLDKA